MMYSKKKESQLIVESCVAYAIEHVVISPGSRNAPLTIGFTNHPNIKTYSIVDERCAAFFALGIAQQTRRPVVVVCTSGSALLNYYPAFAEAFYSDIPLIIISADRPKHLIDIGDGQTIRQPNVFANHSLFNANLLDGERYADENRQSIAEALQTCFIKNGPVHINVPFDEPLYETTDKFDITPLEVTEDLLEIEKTYDLSEFVEIWNTSVKKMVVVGSCYPNEQLQNQLDKLIADDSVLVFTETTSNIHHHKFINSIDNLLFPLHKADFEALKPDVLLTLGGMIVSKRVKQFLRNHKPNHHWHIDIKNAPNTYHALTKHFKVKPTSFFNQFFRRITQRESDYQNKWLSVKEQRDKKQIDFTKNVAYSDFKVFDILLQNLPSHIQLQLGNSSVIRYAQLFSNNPTIEVFCNRGTSGIDGSTSTAIGAAHASNKQTVFITGDISFFYDSNALWNSYLPKNFRIIVVNNSGGGIFKILPGPQKTNVLDYFETQHSLTAEQLCKMHDLEYKKASNTIELSNQLETFFEDSISPKLLEIFTPNDLNDQVLKEYFKNIQ